jgi:hypothetical protein
MLQQEEEEEEELLGVEVRRRKEVMLNLHIREAIMRRK